MTDKLPLSLVVITFNEESNIERCLRSASFVSEIIIVDSFSTDRTKELAQKLGAKVFEESWKGFGAQKQSATNKASNDWVLSLDADEELGSELVQEIKEKFKNLDARVGYKIPRKSFHLGRWINYGAWYPDYQLRLFNKKYSSWTENTIHERVQSPQVNSLTYPILHYVFRDLEHQISTNNRYSTLQAETLYKERNGFSLFKLLTKPPVKFLELYFFKKGFLDGLVGFIIAIGGAYSVFLKFSKLWELEKVKNKSQSQSKVGDIKKLEI